jgi:poly(3-hydroxybutyrate) depolymerase
MRRRPVLALPALAALFLVLGALAGAAPLAPGPGRFTLPHGTEPIEVFTYKPAGATTGPLIVVVHGSDRNAEEYRDWAIPLAEKFRGLVVAPLFDAARFDDERYKRMGGVTRGGVLQPREKWTFAIIAQLVAEVRAREGQPELPYYVIGHSGGAQFVVRMALFAPGDARGFIAANAGSYPFPERDVAFPYGLGGLPEELVGDDALRRFHAAPLTLYLGTGDVWQRKEDGFDASPAAMRQGFVRLGRGQHFYNTSRRYAAAHGWPFRWRIVETPRIGHSGRLMFAAREVEDAFFGTGQPPEFASGNN